MAWTPQSVYCDCVDVKFMPFRTVSSPATRRSRLKWPETSRTDQEWPARGQNDPKIIKITRKGPAGPNNHHNGQPIAPKGQQPTTRTRKPAS